MIFINRYLTILSIIICFASCHRSGNESDALRGKNMSAIDPVKFDLDKIKARGSLIAIVENSSTGYFVYKGRPMGYEYELLNLLADYLEVKLETKLTSSINEAFDMLNRGEGDIIAYSLTVTKARNKFASFTNSHFTTRQVLVQRKPDNWRQITVDDTRKQLIRNQVELIGKSVHVRKGSSYVERLHNLSNEIGGDILIIEEPDTVETESLIKMVAQGKIDFTVADETAANVNAAYYPIIDVKTPISFPQQIAWAVRKNAPQLLDVTNAWLKGIKRAPTFNVIYNRYFKNPRTSARRASSEFSSISGNKISPYDDLARQIAELLQWDWRLIVAQMYKESKFDPNAKSWVGASGLMQLMPETARRFGAENLYSPKQNMAAAGRFLSHLDKLWAKTISDKRERIKFVLASYNVGLGHVVDARNLAEKYDHDPLVWEDNVEKYLQLKSKKEYFTDPIVTSGYCRGDEPVNYVRDILRYYEFYKQLVES